MSARTVLRLLAALALLTPMTAVALPACSPGPHCAMAAAVAADPPCHGSAIQEDDCCLTAAAADPAELMPVIVAGATVIDDGVPAPRPGSADGGLPATCDALAAKPLYRLFRALLI